jgi:hypothetical protein
MQGKIMVSEKAIYEKIISQINTLGLMFKYERSDAINFSDDAEQLRSHYPILADWDDISIQNAWDRYAIAAAGATTLDVSYHEEFIGYLLYLTTLSDPDRLYPEEMICSGDIRDAFEVFSQAKSVAEQRKNIQG